MRVRAWNFETRAPHDVRGLQGLLASGAVRAEDVRCVLGKTEGNGGRNDFTRDLAMGAVRGTCFAPRLGLDPERVQDRIIFSFSGGTEGVVTPHMIVFTRTDEPALAPLASSPPRAKRLAIAVGHTRAFHPEEIGRLPPDPRDRRARPPARQRPRSGRSQRRPPRPDEGRDPALHR
jgi:cyanuric acid amidohydrolase